MHAIHLRQLRDLLPRSQHPPISGAHRNLLRLRAAESFFGSYKKELIHTRPWPDIKQLRKATFDWIETYYNRQRRHSTLGYLTPQEYELGYRDINHIAA